MKVDLELDDVRKTLETVLLEALLELQRDPRYEDPLKDVFELHQKLQPLVSREARLKELL